jgi:hypothetical protein
VLPSERPLDRQPIFLNADDDGPSGGVKTGEFTQEFEPISAIKREFKENKVGSRFGA